MKKRTRVTVIVEQQREEDGLFMEQLTYMGITDRVDVNFERLALLSSSYEWPGLWPGIFGKHDLYDKTLTIRLHAPVEEELRTVNHDE